LPDARVALPRADQLKAKDFMADWNPGYALFAAYKVRKQANVFFLRKKKHHAADPTRPQQHNAVCDCLVGERKAVPPSPRGENWRLFYVL
jgi:hypothetical protein